MRRGIVRAALGLGLPLLLFSCGQNPAPSVSASADSPDGADFPWTYTAPAGKVQPLSLTPNFSPADLTFGLVVSARNGYGPIEINKSNGERLAGDGNTLTLNGKTYATGFGTHANSELRFTLLGATVPSCTYLKTDIGVDDEVGSKGSVVFQVFLDGKKAYDSGKMTGASATKHLDLNIGGAREVRLVVTNAGDGQHYDHADWANPQLYCQANTTHPSGSLDSSFENVRPDFSAADSAVQQDGKIVVFGIGAPLRPGGVPEFVFARYNADGSLDSSFGTGGKTVVIGGSVNTAYQMTVQGDGKIVAAGRSRFPDQVNDAQVNVALLRLLPNGQPDSSFGAGGLALAGPALRGFDDFAVQPDGKIVVVENSDTFSVVRFNASGSLDTGFGAGGRVTTVSSYSSAQAVTVQPDGKIIVGGAEFDGPINTPDSDYGDRLFVRYNPDGSPDSGFGNGGQVLTNGGRFIGHLDDLVVQANGGILYGGGRPELHSCLIARLNANGAPDASFQFVGFNGVTNTYAANIGFALQSDTKIVVSGCDLDLNNNDSTAPVTRVVFRLNSNGAVDTSFGQRDFIPVQDNRDVNIQPGGKILVGLNPIVRLFP